MTREIVFLAFSMAFFLAAYDEGAVNFPWSVSEAAAWSDNGATGESNVAENAASDELGQRRAIWHWATSH